MQRLSRRADTSGKTNEGTLIIETRRLKKPELFLRMLQYDSFDPPLLGIIERNGIAEIEKESVMPNHGEKLLF